MGFEYRSQLVEGHGVASGWLGWLLVQVLYSSDELFGNASRLIHGSFAWDCAVLWVEGSLA